MWCKEVTLCGLWRQSKLDLKLAFELYDFGKFVNLWVSATFAGL